MAVIMKFAGCKDAMLEGWKEKEFKTFLLRCWNCTFAPPNFLNLFSGSLWLWKFAGCKGAMLKGWKEKELKTFLLHCWNCTFAPPNFLNLFSGSVRLWKFAGCKVAMLKGLYYFCSKLLELQLRTSEFSQSVLGFGSVWLWKSAGRTENRE